MADQEKQAVIAPAIAKVESDEDSLSREWTDEDERRIRQRMDWRIVPTVFVLYLMCFIDRANIGNARIQGMAVDLKLGGFRFNWALTIFYISYILAEIPSNIILKKVGGRYYLPSLVVTFGLISMCTAFVKNYEGLLACRFMLGLAEGGTMPGISYYLSCFYKRNELLFRIGLFIQGTTLAGAFGGLLAAGLSSIPSWGVESTPIHSWRNIFFFEGLFTLLISSFAFFVLPSRPDQCKFLTPRDQYIALERINKEHKESAIEATQAKHVRRAIFNINNIICGLGFFAINISVQSFSLFLPSILSALGWTALKTQFYSVPPYVIACIWSILLFRLSDKFNRRGVFLVVGAVLAIVGYVMLATTTSNSVKYGAVFLASAGAFPGGPTWLAWGLNNAAGPSVRAVTSAYIVSVGSCGAIVATWTYLEKDRPTYHRGHWINVGANIVAAILAVAGVVYTQWENKKRDRGDRASRLEGLDDDEKIKLGYRHPDFRYVS
ncbi:hypothetical protein HYFRA_00011343 [Hymenoscyphus fraxineus]|uniref:Major facilitator superfamily (MFS) profile domain-containing protein n=1 Tax=Hymenoscyphus fraxineus TaxID=746836 RepID=A0A9N9KXL8_9HELO|nr:hypothetical protein HYFRA_00011343 [Hymenoscyphus fraxineus]